MSIRPALGWLALLLFTTTAQAEGTRTLLGSPKATRLTARPVASVTPKTKAAPTPTRVVATTAGRLGIVETTGRPRFDYEAEVYAGVPLDAPTAKERGLDKGLVRLVFQEQRRPAFRMARDRIRRVVRLAGEERVVSLVRTSTAAVARPSDHVDVLETEDGVVVVDTVVHDSGMFVTSEIYTFARNATLDQRIGALEVLPVSARARVREALVAAEWAKPSRRD